jgi:hypothetical protein
MPKSKAIVKITKSKLTIEGGRRKTEALVERLMQM